MAQLAYRVCPAVDQPDRPTKDSPHTHLRVSCVRRDVYPPSTSFVSRCFSSGIAGRVNCPCEDNTVCSCVTVMDTHTVTVSRSRINCEISRGSPAAKIPFPWSLVSLRSRKFHFFGSPGNPIPEKSNSSPSAGFPPFFGRRFHFSGLCDGSTDDFFALLCKDFIFHSFQTPSLPFQTHFGRRFQFSIASRRFSHRRETLTVDRSFLRRAGLR